MDCVKKYRDGDEELAPPPSKKNIGETEEKPQNWVVFEQLFKHNETEPSIEQPQQCHQVFLSPGMGGLGLL